MKFHILIAAISLLILPCTADHLYRESIAKCPPIPKHERATSVEHLRPDDIEVVAAMGDSFTAGGDSDAISVPNFLKHYSPNLYGASKGQRNARLCTETFFCFNSYHEPKIDFLNAAQSGATSLELPEQVNYLIARLGPGTPLAKKWKMINVFIGYNDATAFCFPDRNASFYEAHVFTAIKKLSNSIDYAYINLVGLNTFTTLIQRPLDADGYLKHFEHQDINLRTFECYCCTRPGFRQEELTRSTRSIDLAIQKVSSRLRAEGFRNKVTTVYQPLHVLDESVPFNAVR
ncbi:hypothetical protein K501DRAFT_185504 [Backusella circina FSU 941]|nr:hypothetical protein K501DRAFT_185504 [Backusella circina FSU 941]